MNGRQFGAPSSPERGGASPLQQTSPAQEQQRTTPARESASRPAVRDTARRDVSHVQRPQRKGLLVIAIVVIIAILAIAGWFWFGKMKSSAILPGVDKNVYQAVFLTNGQTYFGKMQSSGEYIKLTDIYYLESQKTDDPESDAKASGANNQDTSAQPSLQLFKVTDATVIGPQDEMYLSKDQVLFYENLKSDSKVMQSIEKYKQTRQ